MRYKDITFIHRQSSRIKCQIYFEVSKKTQAYIPCKQISNGCLLTIYTQVYVLLDREMSFAAGGLDRVLLVQEAGRLARAPRDTVVRVTAPFTEPRFPALSRPVHAVCPRVLAEVVGAHESLVAHRALETLLPGVCA